MVESLASRIREANKAVVVEWNLDAIPKHFSPVYLVHITGRTMPGGHATVRNVLSELRDAFPKIKVEVEILLEGKDRIAWQRTMTAVHENAFKGFPGSGRKMIWRDMVVSRFEDGLIAEEWVITDLAERLLLARKP